MNVLKPLYNTSTIIRRPPCNLTKGEEIFFGGPSFTCLIPKSYIEELHNVIVTSQGIILKHFLPKKEYIIYYKHDFKNYWKRYLLHVFLKNKKQNIDPHKKYLLIFDNYSGPKGFAHWISDGLTRLVELNDDLKNYTVLVPEYFFKEAIYKDTLSLFDLREIQYIQEKHYVKTKKLFACRHIANTGDYRPLNINKLRNHIHSRINLIHPKVTNEKIYISRQKASRRFVLNETDVIKVITEFGFSIVYMEDYSFAEQVSIAHNAKVLVSIHGGALTNILFMQKGSCVLELRREGDGENCMFFSLADALEVNYYYQFCKGNFNNSTANNFDLVVDCSALKNNLEIILSHEKDHY